MVKMTESAAGDTRILIIGFGAIARGVLEQIPTIPGVNVAAMLVRRESASGKQITIPHGGRLTADFDEIPDDISLAVECAGHEAVAMYGQKLLRRGVDLIVSSVGALANTGLLQELEAASDLGGSRLVPIAGALAGLDSLRAARVGGGLDYVRYTGRKPAAAWPEEALARSSPFPAEPGVRVIFEGTAEGAALSFPKNANVAAAIALAGIGFARTEVRLLADASGSENIHLIEAGGAFGRLSFEICGRPLASNPRTSMLAVSSVVHEIGSWKSQLRQRSK